ncbi:Seven transmembrane MLO family protein [Perilla frutescens var. hirtella]|nr:Seven transmembrane MLO family protein [Perilla frutescens var. hirtella]
MRMILAWMNVLYSGTPPPLCRNTALTLAWLINRHKRALYEALEKVKAELIILGFISLTLVFSQYYIAKICIPPSVADTMLPCSNKEYDKDEEKNHHRLLSYERRVKPAKLPVALR